ncbi:winged helix-turn-helix domain-containing tetratricopeptide repeat protein [Bradyrhizobium sp. SRL28]|uniref:winged helix-turn-helix domain-containing tetratricopeptide repeat protein n=1 Tax=Bradyrhizobium sp. SRL28 TaxID=2836178 RepID=UPI001BDF12DD|nr:winged helix-turn-helix domain-containing tetratricopeptide repeat protein [Bradyrhizobium sp. SRL28]MBT1514441.1 winged helix-turn-helix domain-containing tetratricopeptide repeat protein [Bradyrhizobium sp. SRL28]
MRYLFEDYTFDTERRELHRGVHAVSVTPQVFDLLDYLIRNRERVVSKDDLIGAVWNGRIVSDAALTTRLNAARHATGDSGEAQRLLKTLPRKGFRFVGSVQETQTPAIATVATHPGEQDPERTALPGQSGVMDGEGFGAATHNGGTISDRPRSARLSIVVLPFVNLGGDPEHDSFVEGVAESLTTDLSHSRNLFVIGRNSAFKYKGKEIDVRQVGRELNVRYVLEGSVQRNGNRLRMNVQLIDAENGKHLWAERFEKPIADLFDMQDEIVSRLAYTLHVQLVIAAARRAERLAHPDAKDLNFQGVACLHKGATSEYITQARGFFERALAIDHRSFVALFGMANVDLIAGFSLLTDEPTAGLSAAETNAIKALSLAPDDAHLHLTLGGIYILTSRAVQGIAECEHALALDRNTAKAHGAIGLAKVLMGRAAETEGHVLEALRLSPRDMSANWWMHFMGAAKMHLAADAEAVRWLRRSIEIHHNFPPAHFALAAALGLLGTLDEARSAAQAGLALNPGFTICRLRAAKFSDNPTYLVGQERFCEGMRLAGVPEG